MIKMTTKGFKEAVNGVKDMALGAPRNAEDILSKAAEEVKDEMARETPVLKNILRRSITISKPHDLVREIEPLARNIGGRGEKYAIHVEEGSSGGYWPNIASLKLYTGGDEKLAWAFAANIHRSGTEANPFISRTFAWTNDHLEKWGDNVIAAIVLDFDKA